MNGCGMVSWHGERQGTVVFPNSPTFSISPGLSIFLDTDLQLVSINPCVFWLGIALGVLSDLMRTGRAILGADAFPLQITYSELAFGMVAFSALHGPN
jgi:hypothetical protein